MRSDTLVFIPTYNEAENVGPLCAQLLALQQQPDILFLDDDSPDGTGILLDEIASKHEKIMVVHRKGVRGIGSAHKEGITYAITHGYTTLVTMDCDFTHRPADIAALHGERDADVVVASRFLRKNSLVEWNLFRKTLTIFGHLLTRVLLGIPYDATGAFRLYRLGNIPPRIFDLILSEGYAFFFESLFALHVNNVVIREVPIDLPARTYGHSKMSLREIVRSVARLCAMFVRRWNWRRRFKIKEK